MDYKEIIKNRLDELPLEWKSFVLDDIWRVNVSKISQQLGLSEKQSASLENEVFFVILGMEPPKDFVENIKREVSLDENTAKRIADYVNGAVFSRVMKDLKDYWSKIEQNEKNQPQQPPKERQNNVGSSFEQTILNQAKAMQPARSSEQLVVSSKVPKNLPTGNNEPRKIHDYKEGNDPYREAAE